MSDVQLPSEQVKAIGRKLGADISGIRNTVYDVEGKRVQINVIAAPDPGRAEKLNRTRIDEFTGSPVAEVIDHLWVCLEE